MEKQFAQGLYFKKPSKNAPDFVKGVISIKVAEFGAFLQRFEGEDWVNLDLKESKNGKYYLELNQWTKRSASENLK